MFGVGPHMRAVRRFGRKLRITRHWFSAGILIFFSLAPWCLPAQPAGQGSAAANDKAAIAAISQALRNRDFARAEELTKAALASHPNDCRFLTLRGMAEDGLGNRRMGLTHFQRALKIAPDYLPALEGAAQTAFQLGDPSARPALESILARRPDEPASHAMLGVLDFRKHDCKGAVAHFEKAAPVMAGQRGPLTEFGTCLSLLDRPEKAVQPFADALALDPAQPDARYNLALAQWNAHLPEDALKTIDPLLAQAAPNPDALTLAASIHEAKDETAAAVALLRQAILADPKRVDAYLQFAIVSYDHASPKVGVDILNAGLTQLPKEPRLYLVRGVLLTQLGEFSEAANDFQAANELDPQLHFLRAAEGIVLSQQHDPRKALASFRAAVKAHPEEAYGHYLLAEALQGESKPEGTPEFNEMVREAGRALALEPNMVAAHDLLGAVYVELGQTQKAVEHSRAALAIDPDDQQAVYHLILALRKSGKKDEVAGLVKRLMELQRGSKAKGPAAKKFRLYEVQDTADAADR
jgi:tetratricopeptide (TPR) repeat protein